MANFLATVLFSKLDASEDKQEISHKQRITGMSTNKTPYKTNQRRVTIELGKIS
jgi:hypothetical protein